MTTIKHHDVITCACANCDWSGDISEADECRDFWSRVEPGDTVPAGDCPECGAFCFVEDAKLARGKAAIVLIRDVAREWYGDDASPSDLLDALCEDAEQAGIIKPGEAAEWYAEGDKENGT